MTATREHWQTPDSIKAVPECFRISDDVNGRYQRLCCLDVKQL